MSIISTIRRVLGIEAAEQRAQQEAEERRQERAERQKDRQVLLEAIAALRQPVQPSQESVTAEKAALEAEICRLKAEIAQMRAEQVKAADNAAEAIKTYLKGVGGRLEEHNKTRGVGRPSKEGRKIQIRFDEDLINRLDWLKECIPGFVITEFTNNAVRAELKGFLDENPAILIALDEHLQAIIDKEEKQEESENTTN